MKVNNRNVAIGISLFACIACLTRLCEQYQEHGSDSKTKHDDFPDGDDPFLAGQQVSPNVGSDVHEVTCHKDQHVVQSFLVDGSNCQAHEDSDQRHEVYEPVAQHCLYSGKSVLYQDSDISHLSRNLVGHYGDHNRHDGMFVPRCESDSDCEAISKVVHKRRQQIKVTGCSFAFQIFPTSLFLLNSAVTCFVEFSSNIARVVSQDHDIGHTCQFTASFLWDFLQFCFLQNFELDCFFFPLLFATRFNFRMLMRLFSMLIVIIAPVLMHDSTGLEGPFEDDEEAYGANEDKRDIARVVELTCECLGHDVDHCVSNDRSTCKRVKHAHKVFETGL